MPGQPSDRLLVERWAHVAAANRVLPLPADAQLGRQTPFCLELIDLTSVPLPPALRDGALGTAKIELKLVLSMYDSNTKAFFGRSITTPPLPLDRRQLSGASLGELRLDLPLYAHTPVVDARCVCVAQLVFSVLRPGLEVGEQSGGWALLPLFEGAARARQPAGAAVRSGAPPDAGVGPDAPAEAHVPLYDGSAAALLLAEGPYPWGAAGGAAAPFRALGGARLAYSVRAHPVLLGPAGCAHLMSPSVLYPGERAPPGVQQAPAARAPASGAARSALEAPRLASTFALAVGVELLVLPAQLLEALGAAARDEARARAGGVPPGSSSRLTLGARGARSSGAAAAPGAGAAGGGGGEWTVGSYALALTLHNGHVAVGERRLLALDAEPYDPGGAADAAGASTRAQRRAGGAASAAERAPSAPRLLALTPRAGVDDGEVELPGAFASKHLAIAFELEATLTPPPPPPADAGAARRGAAAPAAAPPAAPRAVLLAEGLLVPFTGATMLCAHGTRVPLVFGPGVSRSSSRVLAAPTAAAARAAPAPAPSAVGLFVSVGPREVQAFSRSLPAVLSKENGVPPAEAQAVGARLRADAATARADAQRAAAPPPGGGGARADRSAAAYVALGGGRVGARAEPPSSEAEQAVATLQRAFRAKRGGGGTAAQFRATRARAGGLMRAYTGEHGRAAFGAWRELTRALAAERARTSITLRARDVTLSDALVPSAGSVYLEAEIPTLRFPVRSARVRAARGPLPLSFSEEVALLDGTRPMREASAALARADPSELDLVLRLCTARGGAEGAGEARGEALVSLWQLLRARRDAVDQHVRFVDGGSGRQVGTARVSVVCVAALLRAAEHAAAAVQPGLASDPTLGARLRGGALEPSTPLTLSPAPGLAAPYATAAGRAELVSRARELDASRAAPLSRAERALIWELLEEGARQPGRYGPAEAGTLGALEHWSEDVRHEVLLHFTAFLPAHSQQQQRRAGADGSDDAAAAADEGAAGGPARAPRSVYLTLQFYDHQPCTTPRALVAPADGAVPAAELARLGAAEAQPLPAALPAARAGDGLRPSSAAAVGGGVGYVDGATAARAGQAADPLLALATGGGGAAPAAQPAADPLLALATGGGGGGGAPPAAASAADPLLALATGGGAQPGAPPPADPLLALATGGGGGGPGAQPGADPLLALATGGGGGAGAGADPLLAAATGAAGAGAPADPLADEARRARSDRLRAGGAPVAAAAAAAPSAAAAALMHDSRGMRAPRGERGAGLLWAYDRSRAREGVGLMVRFTVEPPAPPDADAEGAREWRARAARRFAAYLESRTLSVDVWDGDSLLLLGTARVPLAPLLQPGASEHAGSAVTKHYAAAHVLAPASLRADEPPPPAARRADARAAPVGSVGTLQLMAARVATRVEPPPPPPGAAPDPSAAHAAAAAAKENRRPRGGGSSRARAGNKVRARGLAQAKSGAGEAARELLRSRGLADEEGALRRALHRQQRHERLGLAGSAGGVRARTAPAHGGNFGGAPARAPPATAAAGGAADPLLALAGGGGAPPPATPAAADPLLALATGGGAPPAGTAAAASAADPLLALATGGGTQPGAPPPADPLLALATGGGGVPPTPAAPGGADPLLARALAGGAPGSTGPAAADPIVASARARKQQQQQQQQRGGARGSAGEATPSTRLAPHDPVRAAAHARVSTGQAALAVLAEARASSKAASISRLLRAATSSVATVFPSYGSAEVFELRFRNPYAVEHVFALEVEDAGLGREPGGPAGGAAHELHLITDGAELRAHYAAGRLSVPADAQMLLAASRLFLMPAEEVALPFKFQTWRAARHAAPPPDGASGGSHVLGALPSADERAHIAPRDIAVRVANAAGEVVHALTVKVRPQPFAVSQTFRFHAAEGEMLRARVKVGHAGGGALAAAETPVDAHAHAATFWAEEAVRADGVGGARRQHWCRCSDPDVVVGTEEPGGGAEGDGGAGLEPPAVYIKYRPGRAPALQRFLVALYSDVHLTALREVWEVFVHAHARSELTAIVGERTAGQLLVKAPEGMGAATVECFSSDERVLAFPAQQPTTLVPGNPRAMPFVVRPPLATVSPRTDVVVHAVDTARRALIGSYLVSIRNVVPAVSKSYDVTVEIGRGASKRIALSNPYKAERLFRLHSSRPDLLAFKQETLAVPVGEFRYIGLKFSPDPAISAGVADILVLVNNRDEKNEEAMLVRASFVQPGGRGGVAAAMLDDGE